MKNVKKYLFLFLLIILIIFLGYSYFSNKKSNFNGKFKDDPTPVSTTDWISYTSETGFSFRYPKDFKVIEKNEFIKVADIVLKIGKLNCENPTSSKNISSDFKFYGFKAEINEREKTAYFCNNTNTACLDISKEKERIKITEGFFHSFISTLNINDKFDEILCLK